MKFFILTSILFSLLLSCSEEAHAPTVTFKVIKGNVTKTIEVKKQNEDELKRLLLEHYLEILNTDHHIEIESKLFEKEQSERLSKKHNVKIHTVSSVKIEIWLKKKADQFFLYTSKDTKDYLARAVSINVMVDIITENYFDQEALFKAPSENE